MLSLILKRIIKLNFTAKESFSCSTDTIFAVAANELPAV